MQVSNTSMTDIQTIGCGCAACQGTPNLVGLQGTNDDTGSWVNNDILDGATTGAPTTYGTTEQMVDQLVNGYWQSVNSGSRQWAVETVTYSFGAGYTAAEQNAYHESFSLWSDMANINFQHVGSGGMISILEGNDGSAWSGYNSYSGATWPDRDLTANTISIDTDAWPSLTGYGGYGFTTILHEIGHSIGLGHQGNYNGNVNYDTQVAYLNDNHQYSLMSYNAANRLGTDHWGQSGVWKYSSTPLLYDIAAAQQIYGANMSTRSGNSTYGFNISSDVGQEYNLSAHDSVFAIWDGGGIDTLDLSGYNTNQTITLEQGQFTSAGFMTNNIVIAFNAVIENATGGGGNDTITGNSANNVLLGGNGNDTFNATTGSDTINGGAGTDTVIYTNNISDFLVSITGANTVTFRHNTGGWTDTVTAVENFSFNGTTYAFSELAQFDSARITLQFNHSNGAYVHTSSSNGEEALTANQMGVANVSGDLVTLNRTGAGLTLTINSDNAPHQLQIWGAAGDNTITINGSHSALRVFYNGQDGADTITLNDNIDGRATFWGRGGDDVITGGGANDRIEGGDGNDTLYGGEGIDILLGEAGNDTINGGAETDYITGDDGNDILNGGDGDDKHVWSGGVRIKIGGIHGGNGDDTLNGGDGHDALFGDADDDILNGDAGDDALYGGTGNDTLTGGTGNDHVWGGDGNDTFIAGVGHDSFYGEGGNDVLNYSNASARIMLNLSTFAALDGEGTQDYIVGIEEIIGSGHNDRMEGDSANNIFHGGNGNDMMFGWNGNDTLNGEAGVDYIVGGSGNDTIRGGDGDDKNAWSGGSRVALGGLYGGDGNDTIYGGDGNDFLNGDAGDDILYGDAGHDVIYGGAGNDQFFGGTGNDTFVGGDGIDVADYSGSVARVIVNLSSNSAVDGTGSVDSLSGIENVIATDQNDRLEGDGQNNVLTAGAGNDFVFGWGGNDTLNGDAGTDYISGGAGNDTINGGDGDDRNVWVGGVRTATGGLYGGDGNDTIRGGNGSDAIYGDDGNDALHGDAGNDTIYGGAGDDNIYGGDGSDTIFAGTGDDEIYGGGGADIFMMELNGSYDAIRDFVAADGDRLDFSDILNGFYTNPSTQAITDFIQITTFQGTSIIAVDQNGGGDNFVNIGRLSAVAGMTDEAALEASGVLITL